MSGFPAIKGAVQKPDTGSSNNEVGVKPETTSSDHVNVPFVATSSPNTGHIPTGNMNGGGISNGGSIVIEAKTGISLKEPQCAEKVSMHLLQAEQSRSLLHGMIAGPTSRGPSCRYVLVPAGWRKPENEMVTTIFEALNIPIPPLVFITYKCWGLFPFGLGLKVDEHNCLKIVDDNPTEVEVSFLTTVLTSRLKSIMREVSSSAAQSKAIYMMMEPSGENDFDKLITDTLPSGSTALGMSHFSLDYAHPDSEMHRKNIWSGGMYEAIKENSVVLQEEISNAVHWHETKSCKDPRHGMEFYRKFLDAQQRANGKATMTPARPWLNTGLTHLLLFEDFADQEYFVDCVKSELTAGLFCAGGTAPLLLESIRALRSGMPMFVFKHTVRAGHCLASLLEYHRNSTLALQRQEFTKPGMSDSSVVPTRKATIEELLRPGGRNVYELFSDMDPFVQEVAYNWPNNFNEDAVLLIDPLAEESPDSLLLSIVNVMSSVYTRSPELQ
mmetsp:Transcript_14846/g.24726  ORF Transcript_14846/g.24726 Transcript_14846/m.24726 type:complete len:498 (+) Transcript_14846:237-1730(+)